MSLRTDPGDRLLAGIAGSNPTGGMDVYWVLSGRSLCVGLITRPEESYWVWWWSLDNGEAVLHWGRGAAAAWGEKHMKRSIRIFLSGQIIVRLIIYIVQSGPKVEHHWRSRCWFIVGHIFYSKKRNGFKNEQIKTNKQTNKQTNWWNDTDREWPKYIMTFSLFLKKWA